MLTLLEVRETAASGDASLSLELPFDRRQHSRLRATTVGGEVEVAVFLPRGTVLRHRTLLRASDGRIVEVLAAPEEVSTVRSADAQRLARIAYHLGNRHVPVEVGAGYLRYQRDPVLDAMVRRLGGDVARETTPFEPEAGAYDHAGGPSSGRQEPDESTASDA